MCRVEEHIYFDKDGNRSKFENYIFCRMSNNGRPCTKVKRRTTEYYHKKETIDRNDTPSPVYAPTPDGAGPYHRRPHRNFSLFGQSSTGVNLESDIAFGSEDNKNEASMPIKTHCQLSRTNSSISDADIESSDSDGSYEIRTDFSSRASTPPPAKIISHKDKLGTTQRTSNERTEYTRDREERFRRKGATRRTPSLTEAQLDEQQPILTTYPSSMQGIFLRREIRRHAEMPVRMERKEGHTSYHGAPTSPMSNNYITPTTSTEAVSVSGQANSYRRGSISQPKPLPNSNQRPTKIQANSNRRPSIVQPKPPPSIANNYPRPPSPRLHYPPPISFTNNFDTRPQLARQPSISSLNENPFARLPPLGSEKTSASAPSVPLPPLITHQDKWDDDDVTSDAGSIFSTHSLVSTATTLSKDSGFSSVQIAAATRELLRIIRDDEALHPLYTIAIYGKIGPRKFSNNFRRLLDVCSQGLTEEAEDRLEYFTASLVALKTREISEAILEKYSVGPLYGLLS
ncbi:hypothetical protein GQ44DRAFT_89985 [Phaeosphaeriaceae sp. PMI808]|nr:hypothetical protein GQ44DRAFT_89985 [Phaeosphaeriaceae sp. PMI808]